MTATATIPPASIMIRRLRAPDSCSAASAFQSGVPAAAAAAGPGRGPSPDGWPGGGGPAGPGRPAGCAGSLRGPGPRLLLPGRP